MMTTIMTMLSFRRLSQVQLNAKLQHVQQRSLVCWNKIAKKECSSSSSQNHFLCQEKPVWLRGKEMPPETR
uniref:DNA binding protein n=1 Tax=Arundo donax TaxID=35708 RepID=A0A0A9DV01_ARUDO